MRIHRHAVLYAITLIAGLGTHVATAQTARPATSGAANAQLMQQLQQLGSERTALQADNERMKQELEALRKERDGLKSGQQALDRKVQSSEAQAAASARQRSSTEQELGQAKGRLEELVAKFRETAQALRDVETDRAAARQSLAQRERDLATCSDHNATLLTLNDEVLTKLEQEGFWAHVARSEPFTRIKRTQLQNLADDYRGRAQDQRYPAQQAPRR
jgi:chromosome segregation ATPase